MFKSVYAAVIAGIVIGCTGCKSSEEKKKPPTEFVNVPIAIAAQNIPADSQEKYMYNPVVKSYAIGRTLNRNNEMVESHVTYQEVQSSTWNLNPQPDAQPQLLASQKLKQDNYADPALGLIEKSLVELKKERDMLKTALKEVRVLKKDIKVVNHKYNRQVKQNKIMAENISLLNECIDKMQKRLDKAKNKPDGAALKNSLGIKNNG